MTIILLQPARQMATMRLQCNIHNESLQPAGYLSSRHQRDHLCITRKPNKQQLWQQQQRNLLANWNWLSLGWAKANCLLHLSSFGVGAGKPPSSFSGFVQTSASAGSTLVFKQLTRPGGGAVSKSGLVITLKPIPMTL
jgi:hypothetical protein